MSTGARRGKIKFPFLAHFCLACLRPRPSTMSLITKSQASVEPPPAPAPADDMSAFKSPLHNEHNPNCIALHCNIAPGQAGGTSQVRGALFLTPHRASPVAILCPNPVYWCRVPRPCAKPCVPTRMRVPYPAMRQAILCPLVCRRGALRAQTRQDSPRPCPVTYVLRACISQALSMDIAPNQDQDHQDQDGDDRCDDLYDDLYDDDLVELQSGFDGADGDDLCDDDQPETDDLTLVIMLSSLLAGTSPKARLQLTRTCTHNFRNKTPEEQMKQLQEFASKLPALVDLATETHKALTNGESSFGPPETRVYPHGEPSFAEEFLARAEEFPGERTVLMTTDAGLVGAAQQWEADRAHGGDLDAYRLEAVAGVTVASGYKQQGCSAPGQTDPTRVVQYGLEKRGDGQVGLVAGGCGGTPEEVRDLVAALPEGHPIKKLYESSDGLHLKEGWLGLADACDAVSLKDPQLYIYRACDAPTTGQIPTTQIKVRAFGTTGPWAAPLFEGNPVLLRLGSMHRVFKIYSWAHYLCLIAIFGALWFPWSSAAPQSSKADTAVMFTRHGVVRARGRCGVVARARGVVAAQADAQAAAREALRLAEAEGLTLQPSDNVAGFKGVHFKSGKSKPYVAQVKRGGNCVYLGAFATAEEAALCYARDIAANGLSEWTAARAAAPAPLTAEKALQQAEAEGLVLQPSDNAGGFKGVLFKGGKLSKPYVAQACRGGRVHLGTFATAEEAALCYARYVAVASAAAAATAAAEPPGGEGGGEGGGKSIRMREGRLVGAIYSVKRSRSR